MSSIGLAGLASYSSERDPSAGNFVSFRGTKQTSDIQMALADDDIAGLLLLLLFVLDMDCEHSAGKLS